MMKKNSIRVKERTSCDSSSNRFQEMKVERSAARMKEKDTYGCRERLGIDSVDNHPHIDCRSSL